MIMRKPCCDKEGTNKGAWSKQEDEKLIHYIKIHGEGSWRSLPKAAGLHRCGKSCRLRWINYLRPDIKRGNFAQDEEDLIIKLHALLGNRWSLIAGRLPGRTDNEVKNYWNSHLKRKLANMGIDPNNHRLSANRMHHRQHRVSSTSSSSGGGSITCAPRVPSCPVKCSDEAATSCAEGTPVGLSLDLTIAVPSPPVRSTEEMHETTEMVKDASHGNVDAADPLPTLPLFW